MKIAIILPNSRQTDEAYYNKQELGLAKQLLDLGINVDIFSFSKISNGIKSEVLKQSGERKIRNFRYSGIPLPGQQVLSWSLLKYLSVYGKEYSLLQVHDNTQVLSVLVCFVSRLIKRPCILCQGMYRDYSEYYKLIMQKVYDLIFTRYLLSHVDYIICKTKMAMNYLRTKKIKSNIPIEVTRVGLDSDKFEEGISINDTLDSELPPKIDLLYVGKLEKRREPMFMINLFKNLVRKYSTLVIVIIGDGPLLDICKRKVEELKIEENVIFIPKVKNNLMPVIYKRSKILVLPTRYEIYGMVILEAMYFGVPVIASAEAGPIEIIKDGENGYILAGFVLKEWQYKIEQILNNEKQGEKFSLNACQMVNNNFLWEKLANRFLEIYKETAEKLK